MIVPVVVTRYPASLGEENPANIVPVLVRCVPLSPTVSLSEARSSIHRREKLGALCRAWANVQLLTLDTLTLEMTRPTRRVAFRRLSR